MTENDNNLVLGDSNGGNFLLYQGDDDQIRIDVRLEDETVWLTQRFLGELYGKSVKTINEHIQNIYSEGELAPEATIRKFRIVQTEGSRQVERLVDHYSLEATLAVGYTCSKQSRYSVPQVGNRNTWRISSKGICS